MAIEATDLQTITKYEDLTDQHVAHIQKQVLYGAQSEEFFSQFNDHREWKPGSDTLKYRKLIFPKVAKESVKPSAEGIAPRPTAMEYATFQVKVGIYRDRINYTDEAIKYSVDDVVSDAAVSLKNIAVEKLDIIKGTPWVSSKASITAAKTIVETMRKARIQLIKNKAKPWAQGDFLMMCSPEVMAALEMELEGKTSLDESTKKDIVNAKVRNKYGFDIVECPSELLNNSDGTTHMLVFAGKNPQGLSPVSDYKLKEIEIKRNKLGTGILLDEDGKVTDDANGQVGSVAMNIPGLGAAINDDLCILNCKWTVTTVNESTAQPALATQTGYVSSAKSPA